MASERKMPSPTPRSSIRDALRELRDHRDPRDEAAVQLGRTLIEYGGDPIEPAAFRRSIRQFVSLGIDVAQASRSR